jgi:hypothetical protein
MTLPDTPLRKRPDVVYRELAGDEGGVLLAVDTGAYHGVNPTGLMIWELIDGEHGTDEIVAAFRTRLDDAPADLEQDVVDFLAALHERRLVE